ncbi:sigma-70 family RNA polymerase sigma factor [Streptomyces sp. NPDC052000]|uniref:RNA polymerase sigma factor n=1 Tax=Streptomyces sp. NPDC052000 TaxID=3155676 RepID=UPI00344D19A2
MNDASGQEHHLIEPDPERPALPADFDSFFRRHKDEFLRIAQYRLRNLHDADDALMEAALVMHRKAERILAHPNPIALAYKILNNAIIDFYRNRVRISAREHSVAEPPDSSYLTELRGSDQLDRAMEELRKIAPLQAQCLELHHLAELTYKEIALRLEISESAAKTNACKGKKKLEHLMLMDLPDMEKGDS